MFDETCYWTHDESDVQTGVQDLTVLWEAPKDMGDLEDTGSKDMEDMGLEDMNMEDRTDLKVEQENPTDLKVKQKDREDLKV